MRLVHLHLAMADAARGTRVRFTNECVKELVKEKLDVHNLLLAVNSGKDVFLEGTDVKVTVSGLWERICTRVQDSLPPRRWEI